ncbi:hypothetical protein LCGC14_2498140, partial [marine sediment metagenome]
MRHPNGAAGSAGSATIAVEAGPVNPIPNGETLSAFIRERFDGFSRSQKDVARYIV